MSDRFEIIDTPLSDLKIIQRKPLADSRGYLERLFCTQEFSVVFPGKAIMQINHTLTTKRGAVRGMHFQFSPHSESKFVSCLRGEVFDVAVDLRKGSATFLQWHGEKLSADNHKTMLIPEGFAHGFQTLVEDCELLYLHSAAYHPQSEGGLNVQDPAVAITWPEVITDLSPRDESYPMLSNDFSGLTR